MGKVDFVNIFNRVLNLKTNYFEFSRYNLLYNNIKIIIKNVNNSQQDYSSMLENKRAIITRTCAAHVHSTSNIARTGVHAAR